MTNEEGVMADGQGSNMGQNGGSRVTPMRTPGVLGAIFGDCCAHPVDDDGTETWLGCPRELCQRPDHDQSAKNAYEHLHPLEALR